MTETNNKRVALNTLILYFRMILIMLVTLYTSRVILDELGVKDYGIYNVIGGVVMMFSFLNNCMTSSTQRFITFELGKGNIQKLKEIFSTALNIHIFIAIIIVLLAETIGLWFINEKLVIPNDRMHAANWVYQFSILTFCVNIIQVPYNAVLIAHEKMNIYAYISILEAILKLSIAYSLTIVTSDKLIAYGILVFIIQFIIRTIYQIYCKNKYQECQSRFWGSRKLYKEMSSFAGWNLFGSIAWLLRDQGINIVLNMFFGPVINAARGIASQVSNAVMGFITNFQVALNPQITKNYANNNILEMEKLTYLGIKFSFILLFIMSFPLCLNINYILKLWLVDVPDYTAYFIILIMIDSLIGNLFGVPLMTSLSATGKIKSYQITVSCIILCIVPIGYVILKQGYDAPSVLYISIFFTLIAGFIRFFFCHRLIGFSLRNLSQSVLIPISNMTLLSLPIPVYLKLKYFQDNTIKNFIIISLTTILISTISAWFIGIKTNERRTIIQTIKNRIKNK